MLYHICPPYINRIPQQFNLHDLCQYNNAHQTYIFENSNHTDNCSYILIFLSQSICYVITPDTHQWYKIMANKILENHKLACCNDQLPHMILIPPPEPPEFNSFTTIARLTFLQTQNEQPSNIHTQPMHSDSMLSIPNTNNSPQN